MGVSTPLTGQILWDLHRLIQTGSYTVCCPDLPSHPYPWNFPLEVSNSPLGWWRNVGSQPPRWPEAVVPVSIAEDTALYREQESSGLSHKFLPCSLLPPSAMSRDRALMAHETSFYPTSIDTINQYLLSICRCQTYTAQCRSQWWAGYFLIKTKWKWK